MKQLKLLVSHREVLGSTGCKRLRRQGQIPAVIYGKSGNESISINESEFRKLMRATAGSANLIEVSSDKGNPKLTIIEKIQREPATGALLHIDFHEVSANEEMHATLPVHTVGESIGAKFENGTLEIMMHNVDIKCLPKNFPEFITIDVSELHAGQSLHIRDLLAMEGVTFLGDPEAVVVTCSEARKAEVEEVKVEVAESEITESEKKEEPVPSTK